MVSFKVGYSSAVYIVPSAQANCEGHIDFRPVGPVESNKKYPQIPIHRKLRVFLKLARLRCVDTGYVIHINQKKLGNIKKDSKAAYDRAGLESGSPYTLLHTAESWMVHKGVLLYKVENYLGNSVKMIEKHYGHLEHGHFDEAIEAL